MISHVSNTPRCALLRTTLLVGSALMSPTALLAQTAQPDPAGTAEPSVAGVEDQNDIVVTAQKREQSVQDVPISIQVLDTRKLDQLQVRDFRDYVKYLPSVSTTGSNPGQNATVVIRGIVTDGGNYVQGTLPTVGIYLDEQPITTINGAVDLHIYDLARVEVLSGPQGTLFGASSEAGTIRLISNKPDFEKLSGGYDLKLNKYTAGDFGGTAEGFINVPISSSIAFRGTGFYDRIGGYIRNLPSSRTYPSSGITVTNAAYARDDYNPVETYGGRAQLAVKLGEKWTVTPAAMGQVQNRRGSFSEFPARGPNGQLVTQRFGSETGHDSWYQAGLTITGKVADLDVTYSGSYFDRHSDGDNDYADYSYFYDTLYGSGANFFDNAGKLIDPTQTFKASGRSQKISQEARIATPTDKPLHGIAGVFWQWQKERFEYDYVIPNLADSLSVTGHPGTYYYDLGERVDRDMAAFTQWDLDLGRHLTLTAGVRYYRYDNTLHDFNGTKRAEAACIGPAIIAGQPCTSLGVVRSDGSIGPVQVKDDGFTFRANATYKIDGDHLLYATVSDGFRPGGTNSRSTVDPSASISYGAEKLTNYELGTKNTFLDGRATLNLVLFWQDWSDIQLSVETFNSLTGTGGIYTIQNAGNARSKGVELDFSVRPLDGLTISSASTYTDAKLTQDYDNGFGIVASKGQRLPYTPVLKTNVVARYVFDIGRYQAHVQAAEVYQTKAWNNFETRNRAIFGQRNSYGVTDVSAGVAWDRMTFELYASNLFDARGITRLSGGCGVSTCNGNRYVIYNQPRLIGVRFGQRF